MQLEELIVSVARAFDGAGLHFGHGTGNAMDEAHWLVLHVLGIPVDQPVEDYSLSVGDRERLKVEELTTARIEQRVPLAYLINEAWFAGLSFYVDERVLVPRSPIAELIHDGFSYWRDPGSVNRVLDLCTGSGCIGIACAYAFPDADIVCSDISTDALSVAAINVERHDMHSNVTLTQSDLFDSLEGRFDLIVSNPPYVDEQDMRELAAEYQAEPELGLTA